jgi:hypothetical protein
MCKEMPVIWVDRVVNKKRIIVKNGGPRRRRRGTRGPDLTKSQNVDGVCIFPFFLKATTLTLAGFDLTISRSPRWRRRYQAIRAGESIFHSGQPKRPKNYIDSISIQWLG